jgi:hypothetical protein
LFEVVLEVETFMIVEAVINSKKLSPFSEAVSRSATQEFSEM